MDKVRFGIVGLGNQGTLYTKIIEEKKQVENGVLAAVCDIDPARIDAIKTLLGDAADKIAYFDDAETMFKSGLIDIALIETPHYDHPTLAIKALNAGIHCCVDKPAGVYTKQVREMLAVAEKSDKILGIMFNQRTNPIFRKMRDMIAGGEIGDIKRTNWIITDWYRTQIYYDSGAWRATWSGEGGGVLYNQAPHQLDLLQWIVGMTPSAVHAFCHNGKWHDIEVEDDVTAYMEWPNGATGVFITTTADAPGANRFEVTGTKGTLVYEKGTLTFIKLEEDEREYCVKSEKPFSRPASTTEIVEITKNEPHLDQHAGILNNLANAILGIEPLYAPAKDGINGVALANACHLSAWLDKTVEMPFDDDLFFNLLSERIKTSRRKLDVKAVGEQDMSKSF